MTTASTTTVVDMTSDAGFRNWVQEIITMLFTTLGATQTADTGQINTTTVTRPGTANTSAGYVIGRFNDTAQATSPVFFKLEFGTAAVATTSVQMWMTIATNSNGSGTLSGVVGTRVSMGGGTPASSSTAYVTRGVYNTSVGMLWLVWKLGGIGIQNQSAGGFAIFRSANNSGTVTTDAVTLMANSSTASASSTIGGIQFISYLTSTAYSGTTTPFPSTGWQSWGFLPFNLISTGYSGNTQLGLCFQFTPVLGITPWVALGLVGEEPVGGTFSSTIIGSTAHTYIAVGTGPCGTVNSLTNSQYPATGGAATSVTMILLWE